MGNSRNGCSLQLGINLNSGAAIKEATGTRCAEKIGFGKSETRKKFGGDTPHKKVMDGVEDTDIFYCTKFVGRPKWGHREFQPLTPQIQPKFGLVKIAKLTAKIIHVNCQMQQDKVVHPMPMFKLRLDV